MNPCPKLSYVCPIRWDELVGDEREKFCSKCGHHVSNVSLMNAAEREALLARADAERVCVSFYRLRSGEMVTPDTRLTREERSRIKQLGVAALSAGALALAAGCTSAPASTAQQTKPGLTQSKDDKVVLPVFGIVAPSK